ncbi:hypothetical protein [Acinetobacter sp.]|uniref:hypothetical protein n=1 Tax=Acinetobacter sp. TaxID=472 RepID=UPI0033402B5D
MTVDQSYTPYCAARCSASQVYLPFFLFKKCHGANLHFLWLIRRSNWARKSNQKYLINVIFGKIDCNSIHTNPTLHTHQNATILMLRRV